MAALRWGYVFFMPPDYAKRVSEIELEHKLKTEGDPEYPPPRRPGDRYLVGGAIVGFVLGGVAAGVAAWAYPGVPAVAIVFGGLVVGGLIGVFVGDRLRQRALARQSAARGHRP